MTARFTELDGEQVAAELNRRGVIVSPRFGSTRFSPHLFNTPGDIDGGADCVRRRARADGERREGLDIETLSEKPRLRAF